MKKIFLGILLFFLAFTVFAEPSSIVKGTIVDASSHTPLDFVNVAIFKQGSEKPIKGVVSDKNGSFVIPSIATGSYTIRISFIGYNTVKQEFSMTGGAVNLGQIKLEENSKKLKEVEVVGQGTTMKFEVDKKVFNVDQNIAASGGSASDILKNIPSVTVDNQGNVALRNDGNVQVWINGKASGLTADNRAQVLQQMPAESIQSIEIIDNPSAKYSPEGTAGIINIVMKQNRKAGYYGSLTAGITYPDGGKLGENFGASINYSSSKFDAYANLGYRAMSFQGGGSTNRNNFSGKDTTLLKQTNQMNNAFSGIFVRAGIDYHLDKKNTLNLSGFGMAGSGTQGSNANYKLFNDLYNPNALLRNYNQNNNGTGTRPSLNLNLGFTHEFNKGSNIVANLSYSSHNRGGNSTYTRYTDTIINPQSKLTQNLVSQNTEYEFKLDYTNKLTESSKLEAGLQSDISNRLSGSSGVNNLLLDINQNPTDIPSYYDSFNYNEQIHAGYLTYGNKIGNLNFQLGLRGELLLKDYADTTKNLITHIKEFQVSQQILPFHLFPSFFLSYTLPNKAGDLQFNLSSRVNRSRGNTINPYKNYSDSTNVTFGNPDLTPQYSINLELSYIKAWGAQTLSTSLYTHLTNDVVQSVHYLYKGVMQSTFVNVPKSQNTGLELISKNRLFNFVDLTTTVNVYYSKLDAAIYINPKDTSIVIPIQGQSNLSWTGNIMAKFMLSKTLSGQITGQYSSSQLISQGTEHAKYTIDLGLKNSFLNRMLNVSLNVRDLLNSDRGYQTTSGTGFSQTTSSYFHGRMIGLTVNLAFGNMKPKPSEIKKLQNGGGDMIDNGE